jgi:hypothetical protein
MMVKRCEEVLMIDQEAMDSLIVTCHRRSKNGRVVILEHIHLQSRKVLQYLIQNTAISSHDRNAPWVRMGEHGRVDQSLGSEWYGDRTRHAILTGHRCVGVRNVLHRIPSSLTAEK